MVQMPKGISVSTLAIGEAGAVNAALSVVAVLALSDEAVKTKLTQYRATQAEKVRNTVLPELV
jgi:5-(carboxyamino)imidazole ribonucleotide mutase